MKIIRLLSIVLLAFTIVSCKDKKDSGVPENTINPDAMKNPATASETQDKNKVPVFQFEEETHDFGTITDGEKIQYAFRFKNVGNGDLVIRSANGSCGCTVPEWPKEPIPPGGSGTINITFDSAGKVGAQNKSITIISNTIPNTKTIYITGDVLAADGSKAEGRAGHNH